MLRLLPVAEQPVGFSLPPPEGSYLPPPEPVEEPPEGASLSSPACPAGLEPFSTLDLYLPEPEGFVTGLRCALLCLTRQERAQFPAGEERPCLPIGPLQGEEAMR